MNLFQMHDIQLVLYLSMGAVYSCLAVCEGQSCFSHCPRPGSPDTEISCSKWGVLRIGRRRVFWDGQMYCRQFIWLFLSTVLMVQNCKMSSTYFDGVKCEMGKRNMS